MSNISFNRHLEEYKNADFSKNLTRIIGTKIPFINNYIWNKK